MSTYVVFLKDGSSYETPSGNLAQVQRLLAGSIDYIQPKDAPEPTIQEVETEPLIKADDYSLKELKDMAKRLDVELPARAKKETIVELLNEKLN